MFAVHRHQRQIVKFRLARKDKGQSAVLVVGFFVFAEQFHEHRADNLAMRAAQRLAHSLADIGDAPFAVGGPEPAPATFLEILQQLQRGFR